MISYHLSAMVIVMAHKNSENWSPYKARHSKARTQNGRHKKPQKVYSFEEADQRMKDIFYNHGMADLPKKQRHQLVRFYCLLMEEQKRQNFTRLTSLREVTIKHFIDCLMIPKLVSLEFPLMDLGSGPGFPGVPLKIAFPERRVLLAEGVQKRVEFLKFVRQQLNLDQLDIVGRNIDSRFVLPVQGVITRAVEDIGNTLGNVLNCLQTGGSVYFMKGPGVDPEIEKAEQQWQAYYQKEKDISYQLPETPHHRRLVVFTKHSAAPEVPLEELNS